MNFLGVFYSDDWIIDDIDDLNLGIYAYCICFDLERLLDFVIAFEFIEHLLRSEKSKLLL